MFALPGRVRRRSTRRPSRRRSASCARRPASARCTSSSCAPTPIRRATRAAGCPRSPTWRSCGRRRCRPSAPPDREALLAPGRRPARARAGPRADRRRRALAPARARGRQGMVRARRRPGCCPEPFTLRPGAAALRGAARRGGRRGELPPRRARDGAGGGHGRDAPRGPGAAGPGVPAGARVITCVPRRSRRPSRRAPGWSAARSRHRGEELLGQRDGLDGVGRSGSTFGHPAAASVGQPARRLVLRGRRPGDRVTRLAGAAERGARLPIHGLLRRPEWAVGRAADDRGSAAGFDGGGSRRSRSRNAARRARCADDRLGGHDAHAHERLPVPLSFGWHPYLRCRACRSRNGRSTSRSPRAGARREHGSRPARVESRRPPGLGDRGRSTTCTRPGAPRLLRSPAAGARSVSGSATVFARAAVRDQDKSCLAFEPMMAPTDALRSGEALRSVAPGHEAGELPDQRSAKSARRSHKADELKYTCITRRRATHVARA